MIKSLQVHSHALETLSYIGRLHLLISRAAEIAVCITRRISKLYPSRCITHHRLGKRFWGV